MTTWGPFFAFLSSCTWAIGSTYFSRFSRSYRPYDVNFTRALFAFPLFVLAVFVTSGGWSEGLQAYGELNARNSGWFLLSVFASYAIGDVLFLMSTISLGVPGALAIASGFPILTALLGFVFEGETLSLTQWTGLSLAVGGIILVILNDPKRTGQPPDESRVHPFIRKKWVGVTLASVTAIAWAMNGYSVMKGGQNLSSAVGNTVRMGLSLPIIFILSVLTTRKVARPLPGSLIRRYAWVFVIESFFGSYFFVYGISHTPLVLGNTLAALAPVLSVPVAVAMKLEQFSRVRTLAVITVVVGLSLLFR